MAKIHTGKAHGRELVATGKGDAVLAGPKFV